MRTRIMKRVGLVAAAVLGTSVVTLTLVAPALTIAGN